MTTFKTGVHTIEFMTPKQLNFSALPREYKGAIEPLHGNRYKLNVTKLPYAGEYNPPADTQRGIEEAFAAFYDTGAGYPKITRIDYRFDDHNGTYADHLPLMTVVVNLIAHKGGVFDRRVFFADGNQIITSVRCMPHDNDHSTKYGAEYYDKPQQAKTDRYGNARLELRRLNMDGGSVRYVVTEWRDLLQSITRMDYRAMLEEHARSLYTTKQDGETATEFINRTRGKLIAYEEWNAIHKAAGKQTNHYERLPPLPKWTDVKAFLDDLTAHLDEALAQPPSSSPHPEKVLNEPPF